MAPSVREVGLFFWRGGDQLLEKRDVYATDLVQQFYGIVETTAAISHHSATLVEYLDLSPICGLTRVDYS
ncbi:hypothetical protein GGI20_006353, partial [Coemansia sp. BCRC 34301]